jgi:hypothetical protein
MIVSSGVRCDVCGDLILLDRMQEFSVACIDQRLHCHTGDLGHDCKAQLKAAGTDWTKLPDGPLREFFEEHAEEEAGEVS